MTIQEQQEYMERIHAALREAGFNPSILHTLPAAYIAAALALNVK